MSQEYLRSRAFAVVAITVVIVAATVYLRGLQYQPVTFNRPVPVGNNSAPQRIRPEQGYLLAVDFNQQITASFGAFTQLSKIASLLNLSTVEPYVSGTKFRGVPTIENSKEAVTLGTLYDVKSIQNTLQSCGYVNELVSFEAITKKANHNIIYVSFISFKSRYSSHHEKIMEVDLNNTIASEMQYFNDLKEWVSHISNKKSLSLKLSRIVAVDAQPNVPVYLSNITKVLGSIIREEVAKHGSATVVFGRWRGLHNTTDSNFFYYIPDFLYGTCSIYSVKHSKTVIQAAHEFSLTESQIHPVIGVHIRGERLLMDSRGDDYYQNCLEELKTFLQELINSKKASRDSVHVFHDLGQYGTKSCDGDLYCVRGKTALVSHIRKLGFPVVFFDPTNFNHFPLNHGFIASVEQEYLIHVDVLVTVGGGGFQQNIVTNFLRYSGESNLHRICSSVRQRKRRVET